MSRHPYGGTLDSGSETVGALAGSARSARGIGAGHPATGVLPGKAKRRAARRKQDQDHRSHTQNAPPPAPGVIAGALIKYRRWLRW
jgi:hypothetical protein